MTTSTIPLHQLSDPSEPVLPLRDGQRLSQPEFHRRYLATPEGVKAELVEGIVHMASPLGLRHGYSGFCMGGVLGNYAAATPGVQGADNATRILGPRSEPQPDLSLHLPPEHGGRTGDEQGILTGPPELVIEVADSTESLDLNAKRRDYDRAGVSEYLVLLLQRGRLRAFGPGGAEYPVDADGIDRSHVFPGLWIDVAAVLAGDIRKALRTLNKGLRTPEHRAFVELLNPRPPKAPKTTKPAKSTKRAKATGDRPKPRRRK